MQWHAERQEEDPEMGYMLTHPSDAGQQALDIAFPRFGGDARNIRLGMSTDGLNPFGNQSSTHSTWPVFVWPYNLPPWLCTKQRYLDVAKKRFTGMKSHDCHVLMTQILPVAIRGIMDEHVRDTLFGLCNFFDVITRKSIGVRQLKMLQDEIVVILCELEIYFPHSVIYASISFSMSLKTSSSSAQRSSTT
ncbi:hypothetical protein QYE76_035148 [Lolium multiflorum]|uniref:Uncharacterized protein n=1 Tax=Lolium multiflorum TaxID=4521 RepID=A0AAD8QYG5_LOLMU|nr:hypothetical protein QYE76_035148 [Lolium multiflorum]